MMHFLLLLLEHLKCQREDWIDYDTVWCIVSSYHRPTSIRLIKNPDNLNGELGFCVEYSSPIERAKERKIEAIFFSHLLASQRIPSNTDCQRQTKVKRREKTKTATDVTKNRRRYEVVYFRKFVIAIAHCWTYFSSRWFVCFFFSSFIRNWSIFIPTTFHLIGAFDCIVVSKTTVRVLSSKLL